MRTPLLIVLALVAVTLGVVSLRMGETAGGEVPGLPSLRIEDPAGPPPRTSSTNLVAPAAAQVESVPAAAPVETLAGVDAPRALEGLVRDRFGYPVRERVLLLAEGQPHPSEGADLTQFVTAVSSREGRFSLSLPHAGPWRLGIGAPGAPRIPPTEARTLDGTQRAEVVLGGTASLSVVFEEPPVGERVTIDLVTLRENTEGGRGEGRRGGERGTGLREGGGRRFGGRGNVDRGTSLRDLGGGAAGEDAGAGGGEDSGRGGRRGRGGPREDTGSPADAGDERGASATRLADTRAIVAWASPAGLAVQDLDLQSGGGRRGGGERQDRPRPDADPAERQDAPAGPPPEVWRSQDRRTVEGDELAAGPVAFSSLPAGPVARLTLSVGRERYEGVARFTLVADARVEARVLPLVPGSDALTYLTSTKPLATDESPAGVTWSE